MMKMRSLLKKIEEFVFYLLLISAPFETRHLLRMFGSKVIEYNNIYFYFTDILILALFVLWIAREWKNIRWRNLNNEPFNFVFLIIAASFLSLLFSSFFDLALFGWLKLAEMLFLFLYIYKNIKLFRIDLIYLSLFLSGLLQSLIATSQFYLQSSLGLHFLAESPLSPYNSNDAILNTPHLNLLRTYGSFPHPNVLAMFLILSFFMGIGLYFKHSKPANQMLIILGLAFIFFNILITFSRAEIAGFLLGLLIFMMFIFFEKTKFVLKRAIEIAIPLLFFAALVLFSIFEPLFLRAQGVKYDNSAPLRVYYDQAAVRIIESHSLLGVGPDNFVWYFENNLCPKIDVSLYQPVHNVYLLIISEIGILGFILFLIFICSSIYNVSKVMESKLNVLEKMDISIFFIVFLVYLFTMFFDHYMWDIQQGELMFWIILGVLMGIVRYGFV